MSSSLILSRLPGPATGAGNRHSCSSSTGLQKSSFLSGRKLILAIPKSENCVRGGCSYSSTVAYSKSGNNVPKQFREENLKDGLMKNYENVPETLYGLTPSEMDMFMMEEPKISGTVTEESTSANYHYLKHSGTSDMSGKIYSGPEMYNKLSGSMYRGGGGGGGYGGRPRSAPPDLPSLLLDARIVYLGMPIVPAVTELIVAQFMWLDFDNTEKPIFLYINSPGTQNRNRELVGSETDAYAIADAMNFCKADVYTLNLSTAYGQAAMLLSLGKKGYRGVLPHSYAKLHLPTVYKSSGPATDMWIKAEELDVMADYYIELLAKGIGKPKEEIRRDCERPRHFDAQGSIDYGLADKIVDSTDISFEKRNYDAMAAQSKAMRRTALGLQAAPGSGFR